MGRGEPTRPIHFLHGVVDGSGTAACRGCKVSCVAHLQPALSTRCPLRTCPSSRQHAGVVRPMAKLRDHHCGPSTPPSLVLNGEKVIDNQPVIGNTNGEHPFRRISPPLACSASVPGRYTCKVTTPRCATVNVVLPHIRCSVRPADKSREGKKASRDYFSFLGLRLRPRINLCFS